MGTPIFFPFDVFETMHHTLSLSLPIRIEAVKSHGGSCPESMQQGATMSQAEGKKKEIKREFKSGGKAGMLHVFTHIYLKSSFLTVSLRQLLLPSCSI